MAMSTELQSGIGKTIKKEHLYTIMPSEYDIAVETL
jgi:hypothetical protein